MTASTDVRIERKSSIELEPRTLSLAELQYAREAAMYVVNTKTLAEAFMIFTEGLKPVEKLTSNKDSDDEEDMDENYDQVMMYCRDSNHHHTVVKRDVLTAPF